jgi:HrpA-like RNA helicase
LDEIHERTINSEVIMGIIKKTVMDYKNLNVILTSATVDKTAFSKYFF